MTPTHSVLKLSLQKGADFEDRTFAKKLSSLRKAFEANVEKITNNLDDKQIRAANKEEKATLKESIRKECMEG